MIRLSIRIWDGLDSALLTFTLKKLKQNYGYPSLRRCYPGFMTLFFSATLAGVVQPRHGSDHLSGRPLRSEVRTCSQFGRTTRNPTLSH